MPRHFLTGAELSAGELKALIERAQVLKADPTGSHALDHKTVALIFQRPSTRTRVSFETGIVELGGHPMVLRTDELQLSRGESVSDTAYVLSRHVAAIGIRTGPDELVEELAAHATVPVINMLTAGHHPCQALADLMTLQEAFGRLEGLTVAYVGDGNNVARSLAVLGALAGVQVRIASPHAYTLEPTVDTALLTDDPSAAVRGADAVYTDVWVSMNDDPQSAQARRAALAPYRLDDGAPEPRRPARDRAALPSRPRRRGDHRGGSVRRSRSGSGTRPRIAATRRRRCWNL